MLKCIFNKHRLGIGSDWGLSSGSSMIRSILLKRKCRFLFGTFIIQNIRKHIKFEESENVMGFFVVEKMI